MFFRQRQLAYHAKPERPDPIFAKQLQEVLGGQWGEMSVMMTYLFQGWNCRGPEKYKDMIMDIGTEEIGHVEMLATMIARLLETSPVEQQEDMAKNSVIGAVMGGARVEDAIVAGMNPQHVIVSGSGSRPTDSVGNFWTAGFTIASGNLLADFRFNVTAESQGRLQVARLYNMTNDTGVRDMLSYLLARDTMHQNQWLAAIKELEEDGLEMTPVPSNFPQNLEKSEVAYQFLNHSEGTESQQGRWANGPSPDGKGTFTYVDRPPAYTDDEGQLNPVDPRTYGTPPMPVPPAAAK
ncbi:manganese catalase family protein [Microvirga sp. GCM10011540]|uniref:manganese catalase family protein n=1 Tax=Microvirga sp. GCM10011540 TaxID=3317338 RepID=UPI003622705C